MSGPIDPAALFRLDGRTALVTGASSGLGARFARVLAAAGARVALAARRLERLEKLAAELGDGLALELDVTRPEQVERGLDAALEELGRIDVLVNAAGRVDGPGPAHEQTREEFEAVVGLNLVGLFDLCRRTAPIMYSVGGGSIVNVSSVHGLVASSPNDMAAYAASKGGILSLTRELAVQWADRGVRVNALAPGYFRTEATEAMFDSPRGLGWIERNTPLGRPGREGELDGALLFLAGDASSYVTGSTLVVDGGWTAR